MRSTRRGTILTAGLIVLALIAAACGSSSNSSTGTTNGTSSSFDYSSLSGTLNGSGSTFQKDFLDASIQGFSNVASNVTVNYGAGGSSKGKTDLANQVVQYAGTDSTIKPNTLSTFKGGAVLYFPTVAAPITVSYNLSGVTGLKLDPDTLGKIMSGQITKWNDSAIAADNSGLTLPSTTITVVHRSDGSGTTNAFTHYLTLAASPAAWPLGTGDTVNWPTSTKAGNGNQGVAQAITATSGSVGYVDYSTAVASKLVFASIKNKAGSYVAPSLDAASVAVNNATVSSNLTYVALDTAGATAYPITAATYVIVYQTQPSSVLKTLQGWLHYLLTDGQSLAASANYAKLPSGLDQQALAQIDTMKAG